MITVGLNGKVVTAQFSLLEWKILNTVLAAIKPEYEPDQPNVNIYLMSEITRKMDEAGFEMEKFPWIATVLSMEMETRDFAHQVTGPTFRQKMIEELGRMEAEEEVASGCTLQ